MKIDRGFTEASQRSTSLTGVSLCDILCEAPVRSTPTLVLILTINHPWYDSRVFFRVVKSLQKKDVHIHLITACPTNKADFPIEDNFSFEILKSKNKYSIILNFILLGLKMKPDIIICVEPLTLISGLVLKRLINFGRGKPRPYDTGRSTLRPYKPIGNRHYDCRIVYDCHEYYSEAFDEKIKGFAPLYWAFESYFACRFDSIITVNDILVQQFKKINKHVFLCANLPSIEIFDENISEKIYDLIYSGQLSFERGLKTYLKTAKLFKINNKEFNLLIIGSFKNKISEKYFFDYIKFHQLENIVTYKAYLPIKEVLKDIKLSKIGIFVGDKILSPRYNKAISMKILEFLSQNVPVIVNDLDMLKEFVEKSQGGWVIGNVKCKMKNETRRGDVPIASKNGTWGHVPYRCESHELYNLLNEVLNDERLLNEKGKKGFEFLKGNMFWEMQERALYEAVFVKWKT